MAYCRPRLAPLAKHMKWKTTGSLIMLVLAASFVPAQAEPTETVPLWPLYYSTAKPDGSSNVEVLFSAFSRQRSATGGVSGNMIPVFWGTNYFHVIPFYWYWNENYLIIQETGQPTQTLDHRQAVSYY